MLSQREFVHRMKTATAKFVTSFDVIVVVTACTLGIGCGLVGRRYTQSLNERINKVAKAMSNLLARLRIITNR